MRWLLHAFLQGFLNPVHGNVVFSRSKLHALHKSLVFFRSLLLPAVPNLMFCLFFCMFLYICVWFCAYVLQFVAGSSWVELIIWMQFYGVFWEPFMGMSCFFVQKWMHIIKVLCFSVHFCPQLSLIQCFVCICLHILQICVWFCVVRCSLWHAVPESSWSFHAILRCFLRAVYGNVVFSRANMDAHHKSLVFFRSRLLTAVANVMFCMYCLHILQICVWFYACALQSVAGSSWVELIF